MTAELRHPGRRDRGCLRLHERNLLRLCVPPSPTTKHDPPDRHAGNICSKLILPAAPHLRSKKPKSHTPTIDETLLDALDG